MRTRLIPLLLIAAVGASSSCGADAGPTPQPAPSASIVVRAPASIAVRVCPRCGDRVGELEAVVDLVIEETAGVGGQVTGVGVLLSGNGGPIEGPGVFDVETLTRFGVPTMRINPRGSLTMPSIGVHFEPALRGRLPGTLRFTVMFRDDNGHAITAEVVIQVTPS